MPDSKIGVLAGIKGVIFHLHGVVWLVGLVVAQFAPVISSSVVIIPMGAFLPIARSLMSTSGPAGGQGLLNKWLTTGVPQGVARAAGEIAKVGGRVAAEGRSEEITSAVGRLGGFR